ncbi:hypothetical protein [Agrobacterium pusense]|uniref:hypothetical protein n=1 Tax=Agrobacterium pusense TaxID=648995 RepID=UPI001AE4406F|nr:hypothetical protein [Agrobacterium pusense]MBP2614191.1 hypothetical protein [Agrobacterium pusense]
MPQEKTTEGRIPKMTGKRLRASNIISTQMLNAAQLETGKPSVVPLLGSCSRRSGTTELSLKKKISPIGKSCHKRNLPVMMPAKYKSMKNHIFGRGVTGDEQLLKR